MSNKIITADVLNTYGAEIKAYTDTKTRTYELYNTNVLTAVPTATESYYDGRCAVVKVGDKSPYTYDVYQAKKGSDNKCTWSKIFTLPNEKTYKYNFYYDYNYSSTSGSTYWNGSGFSAYYAGQAYQATMANSATTASKTTDIKYYIIDENFNDVLPSSTSTITIDISFEEYDKYWLNFVGGKIVVLRRADVTGGPFLVFKAANLSDFTQTTEGYTVTLYCYGVISSDIITKCIRTNKTYRGYTSDTYGMIMEQVDSDIEIQHKTGTTITDIKYANDPVVGRLYVQLLTGEDFGTEIVDAAKENYYSIYGKGSGDYIEIYDSSAGTTTRITDSATTGIWYDSGLEFDSAGGWYLNYDVEPPFKLQAESTTYEILGSQAAFDCLDKRRPDFKFQYRTTTIADLKIWLEEQFSTVKVVHYFTMHSDTGNIYFDGYYWKTSNTNTFVRGMILSLTYSANISLNINTADQTALLSNIFSTANNGQLSYAAFRANASIAPKDDVGSRNSKQNSDWRDGIITAVTNPTSMEINNAATGKVINFDFDTSHAVLSSSKTWQQPLLTPLNLDWSDWHSVGDHAETITTPEIFDMPCYLGFKDENTIMNYMDQTWNVLKFSPWKIYIKDRDQKDRYYLNFSIFAGEYVIELCDCDTGSYTTIYNTTDDTNNLDKYLLNLGFNNFNPQAYYMSDDNKTISESKICPFKAYFVPFADYTAISAPNVNLGAGMKSIVGEDSNGNKAILSRYTLTLPEYERHFEPCSILKTGYVIPTSITSGGISSGNNTNYYGTVMYNRTGYKKGTLRITWGYIGGSAPATFDITCLDRINTIISDTGVAIKIPVSGSSMPNIYGEAIFPEPQMAQSTLYGYGSYGKISHTTGIITAGHIYTTASTEGGWSLDAIPFCTLTFQVEEL